MHQPRTSVSAMPSNKGHQSSSSTRIVTYSFQYRCINDRSGPQITSLEVLKACMTLFGGALLARKLGYPVGQQFRIQNSGSKVAAMIYLDDGIGRRRSHRTYWSECWLPLRRRRDASSAGLVVHGSAECCANSKYI